MNIKLLTLIGLTAISTSVFAWLPGQQQWCLDMTGAVTYDMNQCQSTIYEKERERQIEFTHQEQLLQRQINGAVEVANIAARGNVPTSNSFTNTSNGSESASNAGATGGQSNANATNNNSNQLSNSNRNTNTSTNEQQQIDEIINRTQQIQTNHNHH